jgi:hypothetical protein
MSSYSDRHCREHVPRPELCFAGRPFTFTSDSS